MKEFFLIAICIFCCNFYIFSSGKDINQELVVINDNTIDFGEIDSSQVNELNNTFKLINKSKHVINIIYVRPTCSCTKTSYDKNSLQPLDTLNINVNLDIRDLKGYFKKKIFVRSTANNKTAILRIKGCIK